MIASWPDRLIEVPVRVFFFAMAALAEDPPATVAWIVALLAIAGLWMLPRMNRWVDRRLAAHRLRTETVADPTSDVSDVVNVPSGDDQWQCLDDIEQIRKLPAARLTRAARARRQLRAATRRDRTRTRI